VRPTDENQAASTRPNLMSSRRGAGEDNILAMLERDSARRPGARMSGVRLASYGAAAALAGILAGGVAWLAYDNHKTAQDLHARHDAATGAAPTVLADASLPPLKPPSPGPSPIVEAPRTAVIVDESARRPDAPAASTVPPLVMLPPGEAAGAKPTLRAPRLVREVAQPKPAKAEPPPVAPRIVAEKRAQALAPRVVAVKKAEKTVEKKAEKSPKLASGTAKPAPARAGAPAKGRVVAAARTRKVSVKPAGAPLDSDVALISAIISQSERHRGERETPSCNATCPPSRPSRR
jgi:hypothetical protein